MLNRTSALKEDLALKKIVKDNHLGKSKFNWREVLTDDRLVQPDLKIESQEGTVDIDLADIADMVGNALTNLLASREDQDVFNKKNQDFVANITREVAKHLLNIPQEPGAANLITQRALNLEIEKTLVDHNAHDVAKSLVINRSHLIQVQQPASTCKVIRRNTQVVPWNENKVEIAIRKAFLSLEKDSSPAIDVAQAVSLRVRDSRRTFIHIEDVQDIAQEELMKAGHFKVAETYILYRAQRSMLREIEGEPVTEAIDPQQNSMVVVKHLDGNTFFWDGADLKERIRYAMIGLEIDMVEEEIEAELRRSLFDEISLADLQKTIILNAKSLIEKDADFAKFAGRILSTYIYEEVIGWNIVKDGIRSLKRFHADYFKHYLKHGIEIKRLSPRLKEFNIDRLAEALDPAADLDFDYLGIQTLYDRYLIVDKTDSKHRRMETPQIFWMRVAMGLFVDEKEEKEEKAISLYTLYKSRRFCSSTPTLFNSGTLHSQLSSCYLYWVDDSIEGIMQRGIAENAYLSKWAGGLGGSWTAVRGTGGYINGTNGESQGIIPFLKLHNDQLVAVNQGGKRRGSGCAYLETWHNDIIEFLELRRNTGDERRRTHDMNTSNWIPDLFMKRMESRENWTLFRSNEVPDLHNIYGKAFEKKYIEYEAKVETGEIWGEKVEAIELWKKMLKMIFETGHPWITFKDPCNVRSPQDHAGVIHSSNLCTEITLNTGADETAVCNLGSIILDNHLEDDGNIDHRKLRNTIRTAVRALDNVIDINFYPTEAARNSNQRHRPIGLGVMGLQNSLFKKNIPFASEEAVEFNDEFMEAIAYYAYEMSSDLAKESGSYSSFKGSKWDRGLLPQDTLDMLEDERGQTVDVPRTSRMDWDSLRTKIQTQGMRNSNVLAIAPTATISNITGTSPCIEPSYKNIFVKSNLSGDFIVLNAHLVRDLKKEGLWDQEMLDNLKYFDGEIQDIEAIPDDLKKKYTTAFGIDYKWLIAAAARRQKWIDQSQSVNLFLPKPELKALSHMYRAAWKQGLKTTYYLRTLGASNIEKATIKSKKEIRGLVAQDTEKKFTEEEKNACSIEAMRNGEECEACQ
ncbi:MAG: ribonucleoside-diphosphate reductase subunit alpha [Verrucomicrobia bacterium]|nr:ribonucleoside-diphosphate reductase subunit alpha [Verrucomicrobiota bacterium]MDA1069257.1 ribonucleoside-diphosphate reductase subunit alpha [Verrucomicrobiota bacterium]